MVLRPPARSSHCVERGEETLLEVTPLVVGRWDVCLGLADLFPQ